MGRKTSDPHVRLSVSIKESLYVRLPHAEQSLSSRVSDLLELGLSRGKNKPVATTHSGNHWGPQSGLGFGPGKPIVLTGQYKNYIAEATAAARARLDAVGLGAKK